MTRCYKWVGPKVGYYIALFKVEGDCVFHYYYDGREVMLGEHCHPLIRSNCWPEEHPQWEEITEKEFKIEVVKLKVEM